MPVTAPPLSRAQAAEVFGLLADRSRLHILELLARHPELDVTALKNAIGRSQAATSISLKVLRLGGLVAFDRRGKRNFYRLTSGLARRLLRLVETDPQTLPP